MTPELLQAISGAKGLPMPIESAQPVDAIAQLLRDERRVRDLIARLRRRGADDPEARLALERLESTPKPFGTTATGRNTRTSKPLEWTHAECAQACQGLEERYFQALRYTYALDDSVFHSLSTRLWEWALERREVLNERDEQGRYVVKSERDRWPATVPTLSGKQERYVRDLVDMWMMEVRQPWRFVRRPNDPDLRQVIMNVSEAVWRRRLSPIYEAIADEFVCWLAIGAGHMRFRLRDEAA